MTDAERWPSSSLSPENNRAVRGARERSRELRHPRAADQEKHGDLVVEAMILAGFRGRSVRLCLNAGYQLRLVRFPAPRWLSDGAFALAVTSRSAYVAHEESPAGRHEPYAWL